MPQPPSEIDIPSVLKDPDFLGLSTIEKRKFLIAADPDFKGLPVAEQSKFVESLTGRNLPPERGAGSRFWEGGKAMVPIPGSIGEAAKYAIPGYGAYQVGKGMVTAEQAEREAATAEAKKSLEHPWEYGVKTGGIPSAAGHVIASTLPLVAPIAQVAGQQAEKGGLAGLGGVITAGVIPMVAGELLGLIPAAKPAALTAEERALTEHRIPQTLGERTGPGILSAESTAGKTAVGAGPMQSFLTRRYVNIVNWANQLMDRMGQRTAQVAGWSGEARESAAEQANLMRQAKATATGKLAETATGVAAPSAEGISTESAGEIVVKGIKGQLGAVKEAASKAHKAVAVAAADATSDLSHTKPILSSVRTEQAPAQALFRSPMPSTFLQGVQRGAISTDAATQMLQQQGPLLNAMSESLEFGDDFSKLKPEEQTIVLKIVTGEEMPTASVSFQTLKVARAGVGELINQLRRSNVHRGSYGRALGRLYGGLSQDTESSLRATGGPPLVQAWKTANALTKEMYSTFYEQSFVRGFIRQMNPTATEDVVTRLMQPGEVTNFETVVKALGTDQQAKQVLARGIIDQVRRSTERTPTGIQGAAEQESRLATLQDALEKRPGIAKLIGDQRYSALKDSIKKMVGTESRNADYQKFLKSVSEGDEGKIAKSAVEDSVYANRLSQLLKSPNQRAGVGLQMTRQLLNDATQGGNFGDQGARFNTVDFASSYRTARGSLAKMLSPEQIKGLDIFSNAMRRLPLSARYAHVGEAFAGQMYTLSSIYAVLHSAQDLAMGNIPGALTSAGYAVAPRLFVELATRPGASRFLAQALTVAPGSPAAASLAAKLAPTVAVTLREAQAGPPTRESIGGMPQ